MSSGIDREIDELLTANGFVFVRRTKHRVYRHISGAQVTVPHSASDVRALKNVAGHIRRALRIASDLRNGRRITLRFGD